MKKWLFILYLFFITTAFATDDPKEFFREWSKIDVTGPLGSDWPDFRYEAFVENRNQETRLDFSTGYRFSPLVSVWNGFSWISPNNSTTPQTYRAWQQVIWELLDKNPIILFQTRTRLEELKREGQPELLLRGRERWRVAFPERLGRKLTPVLYDEIFVNFNQPVWIKQRFIDQNRVFIGVDTPVWKNTFWEFGYINQYIYSTPVNTMVHILSISLMIFLP